ncbi:MAG TPA: hypothetical protein VJU83_02015 [Burkholderiales bacterium]|nr:hypothetical protein [Burkholderiales bacterium]
MDHRQSRKREVKTAWLWLPLLPVVFLLLLDWDRIQDRLAVWRQEPVTFSIPLTITAPSANIESVPASSSRQTPGTRANAATTTGSDPRFMEPAPSVLKIPAAEPEPALPLDPISAPPSIAPDIAELVTPFDPGVLTDKAGP